MNKIEYIKSLQKALEAERKSEEAYYSNINKKISLNDKIAAGLVWSNLEFVRKYYTIGEQIEIEFNRAPGLDGPHKLKTGAGCALHIEFPEARIYNGVISYINRKSIKIIVNAGIDRIDDHSLNKGRKYVELIYDERPYKVMRQAIESIQTSQSPLITEMLQAIIEKKDIYQHQIADHHTIELPNLNKSQNAAINGCYANEKLSIVHGPPGTGKTTTIVELVRLLSKTERKILVTASSNNAVDLLCDGIAQRQIKVLRIGNITRMGDNIVEHTLNEKARNHNDWGHIKKVKIQAEEARKAAQSFKRSFGPSERQERDMMYKEFKDLKKWAKELEHRLLDQIVDESSVIATTLIGSSHSSVTDLIYDTVIIDEASQALEPECWNVILKAKRVILVGDHKQLPPTVKSKEAAKLGLITTLLDKLTPIVKSCYMLNLQYRMNEAILGFSNQKFYNNLLQSVDAVKNHTLPNDTNPLIFIDTSGCGFDENYNTQHRSYHNEGEYFIIREFLLRHQEKIAGATIGLITPYSRQVKFLKEQCAGDADLQPLGIEVGSIDGFQGQERDVIIISLVRSNVNGEIGFLKDERRINVALTRARKKLIIIGDSATLCIHPLYKELVDHVDAKGLYQSAWEYMA